jgi:UDP-glucose 4-epimerase
MVRWWQADLAEVEVVRRLLRTIRPDVTFHLASLVTGSRSLELVLPTLQNNLLTTVNMLTAASEAGSSRLILAGSFEEPSSSEPVPCSPYAAAKAASSGYANMFHTLFQTPITVARIFMVYGPGQSDVGKLVPYVTLNLLSGRSPKLGSGNRLVDWIYVDDVVRGLLLMAQAADVAGRTIDLGSGILVSIREVVMALFDATGSCIVPEFYALPDRPSERTDVANVTESRELIGWEPSTSLTEGLNLTVAWYREQLENGLFSPVEIRQAARA